MDLSGFSWYVGSMGRDDAVAYLQAGAGGTKRTFIVRVSREGLCLTSLLVGGGFSHVIIKQATPTSPFELLCADGSVTMAVSVPALLAKLGYDCSDKPAQTSTAAGQYVVVPEPDRIGSAKSGRTSGSSSSRSFRSAPSPSGGGSASASAGSLTGGSVDYTLRKRAVSQVTLRASSKEIAVTFVTATGSSVDVVPKKTKKLDWSGRGVLDVLAADDALASLGALQQLDLSGNKLTAWTLPAWLTLQVLNLSNNELASCDGVGACLALTSLDLSQNQIASLAPLVPLVGRSLKTLLVAKNAALVAVPDVDFRKNCAPHLKAIVNAHSLAVATAGGSGSTVGGGGANVSTTSGAVKGSIVESVTNLAREVQDVIPELAEGLTGVFAAAAEASPVLKAVVGMALQVIHMRLQAKVNKRMTKLLVSRVESFEHPLTRIDRLLKSDVLEASAKKQVVRRVEELGDAMAETEQLVRKWCALDGKSALKYVKQTLSANAMGKEFVRCDGDLCRLYDLLCKDVQLEITLQAALGDATTTAPLSVAAVADAVQRDTESLHRDLEGIAGSAARLEEMMDEIGWSLESLDSAVSRIAEQQEQLLRGQQRILDKLDQMFQASMPRALLTRDAANKVIENEQAAAFWFDVIASKQDTPNTVPWSQFASAVFCELLLPIGVTASEWAAIVGRVRAKFDTDGDGEVTIYEYNAATRKRTLHEICVAFVDESKQQQQQQQQQRAGSAHYTQLQLQLPARLRVKYPQMSAEQTAMLEALAIDPIQHSPIFHALSSVPRAWFATEESSRVHDIDAHAGGMPAPRLCSDLLLWLDLERGPVSFLNVHSGGVGYINALVAVMQNWAGVNRGTGSDSALIEHAQQRVDVFARMCGVGGNNRVAFTKEASDDDASFDRVLVSAVCPSASYVRERLMRLVNSGGVLVAPCARDDHSVAFVRFSKSSGSGSGSETEMRAIDAKDVRRLERVFKPIIDN
jgi:protein-L-isoaspartate O-methyltransferase